MARDTHIANHIRSMSYDISQGGIGIEHVNQWSGGIHLYPTDEQYLASANLVSDGVPAMAFRSLTRPQFATVASRATSKGIRRVVTPVVPIPHGTGSAISLSSRACEHLDQVQVNTPFGREPARTPLHPTFLTLCPRKPSPYGVI